MSTRNETNATTEPEKYDVLVLGSGTGGKLIAWTMAREGDSNSFHRAEVRRWRVSKYRVLAEQEHHSQREGCFSVRTALGIRDRNWTG